jgi:hypothetical protein
MTTARIHVFSEYESEMNINIKWFHVFNSFPQLTALDLSDCVGLQECMHWKELSDLEHIKKLRLCNIKGLSDSILEILCSETSKIAISIQRLNIRNCPNITSAGITHLYSKYLLFLLSFH